MDMISKERPVDYSDSHSRLEIKLTIGSASGEMLAKLGKLFESFKAAAESLGEGELVYSLGTVSPRNELTLDDVLSRMVPVLAKKAGKSGIDTASLLKMLSDKIAA